jgi:hypothetical protein
MTLVKVLSLLLVATIAVACDSGGDNGSSEDAQSATTTGGMPQCAEVWKAGKTLPVDYSGCTNDGNGGDIEALVTVDCADGSVFTGHQDRYWAVLGGAIKDSGTEGGTADSPEYQADYATCLG